MTILNKVQYFQNKCGCNKTLVYLYPKKKKKKTSQTMTILKQSTIEKFKIYTIEKL